MTQCLVQTLTPVHFATTGNSSATYHLGKRQRTMADGQERSLPPLHAFEASPLPERQNTIRLPPISSLFAREPEVWHGSSSASLQTARHNVSSSVFRPDKELGQRHMPHSHSPKGQHRTSPSDLTASAASDNRAGRKSDLPGARQPTGLPSVRHLALHETLSLQRELPLPSKSPANDTLRYQQSAHPTSARQSWTDHDRATQVSATNVPQSATNADTYITAVPFYPQLTKIWEQIRELNHSRNVPLVDAPKSMARHPEYGVQVSYLLDSIDMELAQLAKFEGRSVAQQVAHAHGLTPFRGSPEVMPPFVDPQMGVRSPDSFPDELSIHSAEQEESSRWQYARDVRMSRHNSFSGGPSPMMPSPSLTASSTSTSHSPAASVVTRMSGMSVAAGLEGWRHAAPGEGDKTLEAKTSTPARKSKAKRRVTKREGETPACLSCGTLSTAEWRRGPTGPRTLCNACGLLFAKITRMRQAEHQRSSSSGVAIAGKPSLSPSSASASASASSVQDPTLEELRQAVVTSSKSHSRFSPPSHFLTATAGLRDASVSGATMEQRPHHMSSSRPEWGSQDYQGSSAGIAFHESGARARQDDGIDSQHRPFDASNRTAMADGSWGSDPWGGRGKVRRMESERKDTTRFDETFDHSRPYFERR